MTGSELMSPQANDLAVYLQKAVARPFVWGEFDCCLFLAEWIDFKHGGAGIAADFIGRYRSRRAAQAIIKREGGLMPLLDKRLPPAGFPRTKEQVAGDAGLVVTHLGETASIRTETGWACKSTGGLIIGAFPLLAAWRL